MEAIPPRTEHDSFASSIERRLSENGFESLLPLRSIDVEHSVFLVGGPESATIEQRRSEKRVSDRLPKEWKSPFYSFCQDHPYILPT